MQFWTSARQVYGVHSTWPLITREGNTRSGTVRTAVVLHCCNHCCGFAPKSLLNTGTITRWYMMCTSRTLWECTALAGVAHYSEQSRLWHCPVWMVPFSKDNGDISIRQIGIPCSYEHEMQGMKFKSRKLEDLRNKVRAKSFKSSKRFSLHTHVLSGLYAMVFSSPCFSQVFPIVLGTMIP